MFVTSHFLVWVRAIATAFVRMYVLVMKRRWKRTRIDGTNTDSRASEGGGEREPRTSVRCVGTFHVRERYSSSSVASSSGLLCLGQHVISVRQYLYPGQARGVQGFLLLRRGNRARGEYVPAIPRSLPGLHLGHRESTCFPP